MTTRVPPWPLRLLERHPRLVGVPLTLVSFVAAVNIPMALGAPMVPWGWLIFALCLTPTLLCADYIRAWPESSITLTAWIFMLWCGLVCGASALLQLMNGNIPLANAVFWERCAAALGFHLSAHVSKRIWPRTDLTSVTAEGQGAT